MDQPNSFIRRARIIIHRALTGAGAGASGAVAYLFLFKDPAEQFYQLCMRPYTGCYPVGTLMSEAIIVVAGLVGMAVVPFAVPALNLIGQMILPQEFEDSLTTEATSD